MIGMMLGMYVPVPIPTRRVKRAREEYDVACPKRKRADMVTEKLTRMVCLEPIRFEKIPARTRVIVLPTERRMNKPVARAWLRVS
jgi:hypothetical protein